ncbi:MAG: hypothetical protein J6B86_04925 [Clostridia bacterium]|nr:hypothetical protein [Clostridia bacterium]
MEFVEYGFSFWFFFFSPDAPSTGKAGPPSPARGRYGNTGAGLGIAARAVALVERVKSEELRVKS